MWLVLDMQSSLLGKKEGNDEEITMEALLTE